MTARQSAAMDRALRIPAPAEIRAARLEAGLTQAAAARMCFASIRAWIKWERGEHPMPRVSWTLYRLMARQATYQTILREINEDRNLPRTVSC